MKDAGWWLDFRALRDFRAVELVTSYRLPLSLGAFKFLAVASICVGGSVAAGLWFLILSLFRDTVLSTGSGLAWQLCSLGVLYSSSL
jgi:hypothetical protein